MKFLLIDFGASYVKSITYDTKSKKSGNLKIITSPFANASSISKQDLYSFLKTNYLESNKYQNILCCTIKGGGYIESTYYSWKVNTIQKRKFCLISGLFEGNQNFHMSSHHKGIIDSKIVLSKLGKLNDKVFYTSLGDTDCVIESINLGINDICINIGTGSQVFYIKDSEIEIESFFPAGRSLLTIDRFLKSFGILDFFDSLNNLTIDDVIKSDIKIDLNFFSQSRNYSSSAGSIIGIEENNFTKNNFLGSIIKSLVIQYESEIIKSNKYHIILLGGIIDKSSIIIEYFRYYYKDYKLSILKEEIPLTLKGLINYLEKNEK